MTSAPYEIGWSRSALRGLDRIPGKAADACVEFVCGSLADDPPRVGKPPRVDLAGRFSARRGDFRVIYEIDDEGCVATIVSVAHRSRVYRER